jgi:ubiquinone biosynthesis protein
MHVPERSLTTMPLLIRFTRALFAFGIILADYLIQRWLTKAFQRPEHDEKLGRSRIRPPKWLRERQKRVDERNADRTLSAMLRLRGVYIKLGQVLSIMGGFLPRPYIKKLQVLQDRVPPHRFHEIDAVIRRDLGKHARDVFAKIEEEPIAAASLGQVHVAYTHDGQKLAVKVLYPGIRDIVRVDMLIVRMAVRIYKWLVPIDGIENSYHALVDLLRRETDYHHEARCMTRMAKNFEGDADILFPAVLPEFSSNDVLTMTFMEGVKITDFEALDRIGVDRKALATRLVQSFYKQVFVDRFFHADPHPGNFLVQAGEGGKPLIVVLDFGAISEANDNLIDGLIEVVQGLFTEDSEKLIDGFLRMGFVAPGANREVLGDITRKYFAKLMKFKDRSPGAFMKADRHELRKEFDPESSVDELRDLMKSVHYPETWFYVERATVMLFWLCATIEPSIDTLQVGFPYVFPLLMAKNQRDAEARAERRKTEKEAAEKAAAAAPAPSDGTEAQAAP